MGPMERYVTMYVAVWVRDDGEAWCCWRPDRHQTRCVCFCLFPRPLEPSPRVACPSSRTQLTNHSRRPHVLSVSTARTPSVAGRQKGGRGWPQEQRKQGLKNLFPSPSSPRVPQGNDGVTLAFARACAKKKKKEKGRVHRQNAFLAPSSVRAIVREVSRTRACCQRRSPPSGETRLRTREDERRKRRRTKREALSGGCESLGVQIQRLWNPTTTTWTIIKPTTTSTHLRKQCAHTHSSKSSAHAPRAQHARKCRAAGASWPASTSTALTSSTPSTTWAPPATTSGACTARGPPRPCTVPATPSMRSASSRTTSARRTWPASSAPRRARRRARAGRLLGRHRWFSSSSSRW
ncbi:hypothetical protein B0J13DRAFT_286232 [Dactylonectria estremocensis]|uniref:Uncharacterized protein n=1 Tax=Dactylonectria estremocensis TaxID=1079267 RepID=A0A9P9J6N8_9HYPO|nr:hypothetical protein B0J13DRAFT_286232 [Dactylonectria estremocensis]